MRRALGETRFELGSMLKNPVIEGVMRLLYYFIRLTKVQYVEYYQKLIPIDSYLPNLRLPTTSTAAKPNSPSDQLRIDEEIQNGLKSQSKIISIVIRNAMEDFHTKHLSDDQMKELNPIIRNAVYTALFTMQYPQAK